jgi:hypothetical protein
MVVGLMKLHTDYDAFHKQLDQIAPVYPENPTLFDERLGDAKGVERLVFRCFLSRSGQRLS